MKKRTEKHPGGRPVGPRMPCGWCGKPQTAREMRKHFTECPKRMMRIEAINSAEK